MEKKVSVMFSYKGRRKNREDNQWIAEVNDLIRSDIYPCRGIILLTQYTYYKVNLK